MNANRVCSIIVLCAATACASVAQDTLAPPPVKGGMYDRPYLLRPSSRIAIGGYVETLLKSEWVEGIHEALSFEARRFNIFLFSAISPSVKLTSELEFEHGTEEIKLETALIDVEFSDALNVRAGILLSPLGKFNLAHDSPRNDFTDRPLVSTGIIPSTLSEVGFGLFGSFYPGDNDRITYEAYLVNGLTDGIILNGDGTTIPAGRPRAFDGDNNASPSFVVRTAWIADQGFEFGLSLHSGLYNSFKSDGLVIDAKRGVTIVAADGEGEIGRFRFQGEFARAKIDIPPSLIGLFAATQQGLYAQATYRLLESVLPQFPGSVLSLGARYDVIDLDAHIRGSNASRLTLGANLRLTPDTVFKLGYQQNWMHDRINNLARSAVIHFGVATYF